MKAALVIVAIAGAVACLSCDGSATGSHVGPGDDAGAASDGGPTPGRAGRTVVDDWPVGDAEGGAAGGLDGTTDVSDASSETTVMLEDAAARPDIMPNILAPAPDAAGPDAGPRPAPRVLRARDLVVTRLTAGVVYAHKLNSKTGHVVRPGGPLSAAQLAAELGAQNLKFEELVVDVLYAHDIDADSARIQESHIDEVKFGLITP